MKYTVLTLFPDLFSGWTSDGLIGKAKNKGIIDFEIRNIRDFANDKHKSVDDTPYGGGAGMVMRVDIIEKALIGLENAEKIMLTPTGKSFNQVVANDLSQKKHLVLLCGRYEGFDARTETLVDQEISIGDFVMMGGEAAALCIIEATARLLPGILGDQESFHNDSFFDGLLDYPEYTRPHIWNDQEVPEILLSGHHAQIEKWRRKQKIKRTLEKRPDLLDKVNLSKEDIEFLDSINKKPAL